MNAFQQGTQWRAKWPNSFQAPGSPLPSKERRHRDVMQRAKNFPSEDYYLSPCDGHLAKLFVQSTQAIYDANPNSSWRRTFIRNQSPLILQLANWVLHSLPTDDREVKGEDVAIMGLKWIPTCAAMLLLVSPTSYKMLLPADPLCIRWSILCKLLEKFVMKANTTPCHTNFGDTHITRETLKRRRLKCSIIQTASPSTRSLHSYNVVRRNKAHPTLFRNGRSSPSISAFSKRSRVWRYAKSRNGKRNTPIRRHIYSSRTPRNSSRRMKSGCFFTMSANVLLELPVSKPTGSDARVWGKPRKSGKTMCGVSAT